MLREVDDLPDVVGIMGELAADCLENRERLAPNFDEALEVRWG